MSRFAQYWSSSLLGDLNEPQIWVICQSPANLTDADPDQAPQVVVLIDFSQRPNDRAAFALLGHAWAGATAVQTLWSHDNVVATLRSICDRRQHLVGVALHVPMTTPSVAIEQALCAVHAALPGLCFIVTDEPASVAVTGATAIVRSAPGHSAVDALTVVRMLVGLASPNDLVCLDVEDVRTVCDSLDESNLTTMRLLSAAWQVDDGQLILARSDAEVLVRAESIWMHVEAWELKGDILRQIVYELRNRCPDDVSLAFNSPFGHSLMAAWGGKNIQLNLLVR